jgi:transcriptional repressor NrdR
MKCPNCGCLEDKVLESRQIAEGNSIRRRRECIKCSYRFTSYELIEEKQLMVVKRDDRREAFSREKLASGIRRAIEKRPVSQADVDLLLQDIEEAALIAAGEHHEIASMVLGEMIMKRLGELDQVAYIRFASVYRQFKDVKEFIKEIENIL